MMMKSVLLVALLAAAAAAHTVKTYSDRNCSTAALTSSEVTADACQTLTTGTYYKMGATVSGQCVSSCYSGSKSACGACTAVGTLYYKYTCDTTAGIAYSASCTDSACSNCSTSTSGTNISSSTCPSTSSSYGTVGSCSWTLSILATDTACTTATYRTPLVCGECTSSTSGYQRVTCGVSVPSALMAAAVVLASALFMVL